MCRKFTADELNTMDHEAKKDVIYRMQKRLDKLEHDYENLMEQVRLASQQRFGRHTEKLDEIAGQISLFNEAEACFDEHAQEPSIDDVVDNALKLVTLVDEQGNIERSELEPFMPWSKSLPIDCYSKRRS